MSAYMNVAEDASMANAGAVSVSMLLEGIEYGGGENILRVLINHIADHLEHSLSDEDVCAILDSMLDQLSTNEDGDRTIINLCLVVLNNLTISEHHAEVFCKHVINSDGYVPKPALHAMIQNFVSHNPQMEDDGLLYDPQSGFSSDMIREDPWAYAGNVLTNIVRCETGRKVLLRQSLGFMPKLLQQVRSRNPVRRRGAVAVIRTCLFDKEVHWWMLNELKVTTTLLYPCVVNTEITEVEKVGMDPVLWMAAADPKKTHEPKVDILHMILESFILLCQVRAGRDSLRKLRIYPICRNLDYEQTDEKASELILEIVNFMHRDEEETSAERALREQREKDAYEAREEQKKWMLSSPADVLAFWFGDDFYDEDSFTKKEHVSARMSLWFGGREEAAFEDRQMKNEVMVRKAASGELCKNDDWEETPRGILARVILLDQFSRCVYRGSAKAFQHDHLTEKICVDLLREDGNKGKGAAWLKYYMRAHERLFIVLALQHSENTECHKLVSRMYDEGILTDGATEEVKEALLATRRYALDHAVVVERFGRYPGRNEALGRVSTAEELEWLASPTCPAWAKSQLPAADATKAEAEAESVVEAAPAPAPAPASTTPALEFAISAGLETAEADGIGLD